MYANKTVKQLQEIAKDLNLKGFWRFSKANLIALLEQNADDSTPKPDIVAKPNSNKTVKELRQIARAKGIKGAWKLKKQQLLEQLEQATDDLPLPERPTPKPRPNKKKPTPRPRPDKKKPTPAPRPDSTIIKLIEDQNRIKEYEATDNLARPINQIFFNKIKSQVEMRTTVVYRFSCIIYRLDGHVSPYHKTFTSKDITSLSELEKYLEECETRRLDLDDVEIWSKAYLPSAGSVNIPGNL